MGLRHRVIVSPRVTANLIEQEDYLAERASPVVGVYFGGEDYESELYELDMEAIKRGEYGVA